MENCDICGYESELWALEKRHIIPVEISRQANTKDSATVGLCPECRRELDEWYLTKVANVVYDTMAKKFIERSGPKMVKEYQSAYNSFVEYRRHHQE